MALRTWHPDVAFSGNKVAGEEMEYMYYTVNNPSIDATAVATAKAIGATGTGSALVENVMGACDVPRNLRVTCAGGTSSGTYGGTVTINGLDQYGEPVTETFSIATAVNGGTAIGTKIFSKFTSGTCTFSGDTAVATCNVGFGTAGTTTLFGIPGKVGGTGDLKNYNWASAHAVQLIHTNALGSYVIANHIQGIYALKARSDFGTASGFTVRVKSTYLGS